MTVYWTVPFTRLISETSIFSALEKHNDLKDRMNILESLGIKGLEVDAHREVNGFFQIHAFVVVLLEHAGCGLAAAAD